MNSYDFGVIRLIRKKKNLTIVQLAKMSGLTYPTLVSIETNKSVPSLTSLDHIAAALGIQTASLILLSQRCDTLKSSALSVDQIVLPKKTKPEICRMASFGDVRIYRIRAQAGMYTDASYPHLDIFEVAYVLHGSVELVVEKQLHILQTDDSFFFNGALKHWYRYLSSGEALIMHIPKESTAMYNLLKLQ